MIDSCVHCFVCDWPYLAQMSTLLTEIDPDMLMLICRHWATLLTVLGSDWLFCRLCWLWLTLIWICVTLSTVIDPDWPMVFYTVIDPVWPMCRFWLLQTTLNLPCVDSFDFDWHRLDPVSTMLTVIDADWNLCDFVDCNWPSSAFCRLSRLRLTVLSCVDCDRTRTSHVSTLSNAIERGWLMCRLRWLWLNLIDSCVDCVDFDRPWLAHLSNLLYNFDSDMLKCQHIRVKPTLIGSRVGFDDCDQPRLAHLPNLLTLIEHNCLVFWLCWRCAILIGLYVDYVELNLTWSACVSNSWLWSTPIGACVEFVDSDWTQSAHFSTVSTLRDPTWLLCWLCRLKLTLIIYLSTLSKKLTLVGSSVDSLNRIRLWLVYVSTLTSLSNLTDFDDRDQSCLHMRQVCRLWSNMISSYVDCRSGSNVSILIDADWRICRLCRIESTLIY